MYSTETESLPTLQQIHSNQRPAIKRSFHHLLSFKNELSILNGQQQQRQHFSSKLHLWYEDLNGIGEEDTEEIRRSFGLEDSLNGLELRSGGEEGKHDYQYDLSECNKALVEKQWKNIHSYFARFRREVLSDRICIWYRNEGLEIKFREGNSNNNANSESEEGKMEEEKEKEWKAFPLNSLPIEVLTPNPSI